MATATMTVTSDRISGTAADSYKKRWDRLRGREYDISRERASLLHEVWHRLQCSDSLLTDFMISVLGEYPGKRCQSFTRMTRAYNSIQTPETWISVGGYGVVFLARMTAHNRRLVMTRVRETLVRTGRETLNMGTFRIIVRETLGDDAYSKLLTERRGQDGRRAELSALKSYLLVLLKKQPALAKDMNIMVRAALGLDIVANRL